MPVKKIRLLGDPILREQCSAVKDVRSKEIAETVTNLRDTLFNFRARQKFGRGIAAPQIGTTKQVIYIDFEYHGALINPKITKRSRQKFTLWDDCFSFPDLLVKVVRNYSIEVAYVNEAGERKKLKADGALSELLQHEIDHIHGILAVDRAIDSKHIVLRSEYEKFSRHQPMMM